MLFWGMSGANFRKMLLFPSSLRDVRFTYPSRPKEEVLEGFNLKVEPGTTVALVSTLLHWRLVCIIQRTFVLWSGTAVAVVGFA